MGNDFFIAFKLASEDSYVSVVRSHIAGFTAESDQSAITILLKDGTRYSVDHTTQMILETTGLELVHCQIPVAS